MTITVNPAASIGGRVSVPGSKSHTIRALLIASMAERTSRITNCLDSADTRSCIEACRVMGADIDIVPGNEIRVTGANEDSFTGGLRHIDTGNSGTTLYLALGLAAGRKTPFRFTGDRQIQTRPVGNLLKSLEDLGASTVCENNNGSAPVTVTGPLKGGRTEISCPTSQFLSSLLLACPLARDSSVISVPLLHERPYAEMTLSWLDSQGIQYRNNGFSTIDIPGRQKYRAFSRAIPGDFSSGTFFLCAAAISQTGLDLEGLDMNDIQGDKAVVSMLEEMGCTTELRDNLLHIHSSGLKGADLDLNETPDALPALAVTAAFAEGTTRLLNVPQARLKETDRIAVMAAELSRLGVETEELDDGLIIHGKGRGLDSGCIDGHFDHRVVMAFAVGALKARGPITVSTAEAADITFPCFFETLESIRR